jgi:hypothetical protein
MKSSLNHLYQAVLVHSSMGGGSDDDNGGNDDHNKEQRTSNERSGNSNLTTTIHSHAQHVKRQLFQLALQVFEMY